MEGELGLTVGSGGASAWSVFWGTKNVPTVKVAVAGTRAR